MILILVNCFRVLDYSTIVQQYRSGFFQAEIFNSKQTCAEIMELFHTTNNGNSAFPSSNICYFVLDYGECLYNVLSYFAPHVTLAI